jgi:hypothetical protein
VLNNTLVHYGHLQSEELFLIKKFALNYNLTFVHDGIVKLSERNPTNPIVSFWEFVDHAKYSNFIVIWNGKQCYGPLITDLCKNKNIPRCYLEWGVLPQIDNFLVDPTGFCGDSILCSDLSWIDNSDINYLYNIRKQLQQHYTIVDDDYVLIPLQIENDSQVLYYSQYSNMYELVCNIINKYPNKKIIIKTHPKNNTSKYLKSWNHQYTEKIKSEKVTIIDSNIPFLELASRASVVVGLTSTCLYEAGILGKPVISLGNHPMSTEFSNIDNILAGILALNINRKTGNLKRVLDRFDIKPKKE